ncbi:MAG: hypothetical protein L3J24_06440 [Xanthomonadales bacterium]|nr:hypothetical protein [Xanthomonadales bacterium]
MSTVDEIKPAIGPFRAYNFDIVSPALPCGAAWLASCLFEIEIPSWNPWGMNNTGDWQHSSENTFQYVPGNHGWKTLFPGLYDARTCVFRTSPVPRFHHSLPGVYPCKPKTVLIIRDPRDCLYSSWRRSLNGKTLSAEGFCKFIDSKHQLSSLSIQKYRKRKVNPTLFF